jgi:ABC-type amino acid transport system permease subunit
VLTVASMIYFALTWPLSRGVDYLHRRFAPESS